MQRGYCKKFTAHYRCRKVDLNLIMSAANGFIFQVTDLLMEPMEVCLTVWRDCKVVSNFIIKVRDRTRNQGPGTRGPFLKKPGNFSGPKANFKIKICWIVAQFLAHKPVNIALLTDKFILSFSKLLEPWSWMQTQKTRNSFLGMKRYWGFHKTDPRTKSSN